MLEALGSMDLDIELLTYPAEMGEDEAIAAGFRPTVVGSIRSGATTSTDTVRAANQMKELMVELLVFVGGDGTARNVLDSIGGDIPVLGVPAGVKLHSSVFAINPRRAAEIVTAYMAGATHTSELEVMDIDEDLVRSGRLSAQIHGYLKVPDQPRLLQGAKTGSSNSRSEVREIAARVVAEMDDDAHYILGPGTTIRAIAERLGIDFTLIGVDVVHRGELVGRDVTEAELYEIASNHRCVIIVAVVGGQGYIFGRGNQQLGPRVIGAVGSHNVQVLATRDKLLALDGPLRVDTGDPDCDRSMSGYRRVTTGRQEDSMWMVEA